MNLFQLLSILSIALLLLREVARLVRGRASRRAFAARFLVLAAAVVAIAEPGIVQWVAVSIGIGRGADVVLYVSVLASILLSFHFYSRFVALERQVTLLVRSLSLEGARRGAADQADRA